MSEDDFYIQMLKFAASKAPEGFSYDEYEGYAVKLYGSINDKTRATLKQVRTDCFHSLNTGPTPVFSLKAEYYFRLIEFQELKESRKSSSDANKHSKVAIGFSIFAIFIGAVVGILQLNSTIKLDNKQVSIMATKDYPATQQVESEQLSQVIDALKQSNINTAELTRIIQEQNAKQVVSGEVRGE